MVLDVYLWCVVRMRSSVEHRFFCMRIILFLAVHSQTYFIDYRVTPLFNLLPWHWLM